MATVLAEKMTKAQAATTMGGSHELLPDFQPVVGLMVKLKLSEQEEVLMRQEIHGMQQISLIIQVLGLQPNLQELRHLLQAQLQAEIGHIVEFEDEAGICPGITCYEIC